MDWITSLYYYESMMGRLKSGKIKSKRYADDNYQILNYYFFAGFGAIT